MRRITWLGHATVLIETADGTRLLTDPLLRSRIMHLRRHAPAPSAALLGAVDGVLVSHVHHDHLDRRSLKSLARTPAGILLPRGAGQLVRSLPFDPIHQVAAGETVRVGGADVRVVPAWHPTRRWPRSSELEALGYLVDGVWFAGDTGLHERMEELRGSVDAALLPIWGWGPSVGPGHLDPEGAARAVALVQPRIAIPIHWGTYLPFGLTRRHGHLLRSPALAFAAHVARYAPSVEVATLSPGDTLDLPPGGA